MQPSIFLHQHAEFEQLIQIISEEMSVFPDLVEKDYWLMHALCSLQQDFKFQLKGGTSLSKGYDCIYRFSEDIDLKIEPDEQRCGFKVFTGKNHDDPKHRDSRKRYFDWLCEQLSGHMPGFVRIVRDHDFDDQHKFRNGGIRLFYEAKFEGNRGLKDGILLEAGFDRTAPNQPRTITSWLYERAAKTPGVDIADNRAIDVPCYEPKYTFVEKLNAVIRKYRLYKTGQQGDTLPVNFIRHYYDLYQLLEREDVKNYVGTPEYESFKAERFGGTDTKIGNSDALKLTSSEDRAAFEAAYARSEGLYFRGRPTLQEILDRMAQYMDRL